MNYIEHRFSLVVEKTVSQTAVKVKRGDTINRLIINLTDHGYPYHISEEVRAFFVDGAIMNACTIDNCSIIYDLTTQTVGTVGRHQAEIRLVGHNDEVITTAKFTIIVEKTIYDDNQTETVPQNDVDALTGLISEASQLVDEINESLENGDFKGETGKSAYEIALEKGFKGTEAEWLASLAADTAEVEALTERAETAANKAESVAANLKEYVEQNFANAFVGKAEGAVVTVDDVSPIEHIVGCKVRSKNLIPYPYVDTTIGRGGLTYTVNGDGTIGIKGTVTEDYSVFVLQNVVELEDGVAYFIGGSPHLYLAYKDRSGATKYVAYNTLTWSKDYTFVRLYLQYSRGTEVDEVIEPMICVGDKNTEYVPYVDASTVKVSRNGEEFSVAADGTVEGMKSLSPSMVISTDNPNALVEIEYNRDSNKVIEDLLKFIDQDGLMPATARIVNISLPANKWVGTASPYSQVVTVAGATERSQVDLTPSVEQLSIFYNKDLTFVTENEDGIVTVYAIGQKPTNDYTMQATVTEVNV